MAAPSKNVDRRPDAGARGPVRRRRIGVRLRDLPSRSRSVISEHRQKRRQRDREVSDQSRRGLDWTNFFMADVQVGFGSFLAFYLAEAGWSKQAIGVALTVGGLAGVLAQAPGGALADAVPWKRGLAALGIIAIALAALGLALRPTAPLVFAVEVLHGVAGGLIAPAIAAMSLGLAGRRAMSLRIGRNLRFAAAGNAVSAAVMGGLGVYFSNSAIFVAAAMLCLPALLALAQIRPEEIDYVRARNSTRKDQAFSLDRVVDLAKNRDLLVFFGCMILFHFSNASLLPLVSENLGQSKVAFSPLYVAGLLIVPQVVVAILAPWIGYGSELWGRKPLLVVGFSLEAGRALLFMFVSNPWHMLAIQLLDGVTGAIITVLTILVVTDLTTGTGRFNLAQGVLGTMIGLATATSTSTIGFIVLKFGDAAGFIVMAASILAGTALLWGCLPETKPATYLD
jgi:MFS family permease